MKFCFQFTTLIFLFSIITGNESFALISSLNIMLEANLYELREKYQRALREKNIEESIISGIAYYQAYRNGIPLEEDREKIQNDIFNALAKEDPL